MDWWDQHKVGCHTVWNSQCFWDIIWFANGLVATATERIINGKIKAIDVGSVNNHYFVCMAGVGFDAYIIKKAEQSSKKQ